ncbi:SUMO-interacting motif-containing protein 1 isoform X2 [Thalassophryne amazonica]|nr:SUMO-interacting motif-containing protein 1 isoform X2 [Thalassophryne amazonica]
MDEMMALSSNTDQDDSGVGVVDLDPEGKGDLNLEHLVRLEDSECILECYNDLSELMRSIRGDSTSNEDGLNGNNRTNRTEHITKSFAASDKSNEKCLIEKENTRVNQSSTTKAFNSHKGKPDLAVVSLGQKSILPKPYQMYLNSEIKSPEPANEGKCSDPRLAIKIKQLPINKGSLTKHKTTRPAFCVADACDKLREHPRQLNNSNVAPQCFAHLTSSDVKIQCSVAKSLVVAELRLSPEQKDTSTEMINTQLLYNSKNSHPLQRSLGDQNFVTDTMDDKNSEDKRDVFFSSATPISPTLSASSPQKSSGSAQMDQHANISPTATDLRTKQLEMDKADSRQVYLSNVSTLHCSVKGLNSPQSFDIDTMSNTSPASHCGFLKSQVDSASTTQHSPNGNAFIKLGEDANANVTLNNPDFLCTSISNDSYMSVSGNKDMDEGSYTETYRDDLEIDSPVPLHWQEGSDGQAKEESIFDMDVFDGSQEDRHYVCPVKLKKILSATEQVLYDDELDRPQVLRHQTLCLVYSTIDENYPEGTLQLLADFLQPGYYPPKDITSHLLRKILLNIKYPHHLCVQAFNLLMRTQSHHMADKTTVPWDWELLTSVMENQDYINRHRCEIVCMVLEYVMQTLEDDFQAKRSALTLSHSIAKATLSCDQQFPQVRDVLKWLFYAIKKSTEYGEGDEAAKERDEHIRMVCVFQRMLSLALEVDCCPALSSAKLSQELFHMLISSTLLREHRLMLLNNLQSSLLRCKLLEQLLDYICPLKSSVPMSLSLVLHFLMNCTLTPDPTDGTERWQRWEELVHLLWMLFLSYNKAMAGYLRSTDGDQSTRVATLVYKPHDVLTTASVHEAIQAFLNRAQADLGQELPPHVEEALTYLQDHLLDVCQ